MFVVTTIGTFTVKITFVVTTFGTFTVKIPFVATTFGIFTMISPFAATGNLPAEGVPYLLGSTCSYFSRVMF